MNNAWPRPTLDIPPGFEAEVLEWNRLQTASPNDLWALSQRIELVEALLRRIKPRRYPVFCAFLQGDLGNAYLLAPFGDHTDNLRKAIDCYEASLTVFNTRSTPLYYAKSQNNLGNAYRQLPTRDRTRNLYKAIACHKAALSVFTPEVDSLEYAGTHRNLAYAYMALAVTGGNRTDAMLNAIASYETALTVFTPEDAPSDCVAIQVELGAAYTELQAGNRTVNIRKAIACYRAALAILGAEADPFEIASIRANLGTAYCLLQGPDIAESLFEAIASYEAALTAFTSEATPGYFAMIQSNLGNAYSNLQAGDRAKNLRKALNCYRAALTIVNPESAPLQYGGIHINMGLAYTNMPMGDRADNLQKAIASYKAALTVYTPDTDQYHYATAQNNLGNVYTHLPTSDRLANLWKAIACFQEALRFRTPETAPYDYAATQDNLGSAYMELPLTGRAENVERAIACFQEALRFRTPETAAFDYAKTQNNLGIALHEMADWEGEVASQRAIVCFEAALAIFTLDAAPEQYAAVQHNLGNTYCTLAMGEQESNLRKAITCYRNALKVSTVETNPFNYASIQNDLGNAYGRLSIVESADNLREAAACYREALAFLTPDAFPHRCRKAAFNLGNLYFRECRWDEAREAYFVAIAAREAAYKIAVTGASQQAELAETNELVPNLAFSLARLDRLGEAVTQVESGRARGLAETLARDRAILGELEPVDRDEFEAACHRIRSLEVEARSVSPSEAVSCPTSRAFSEISEDLRNARLALESVVAHIRSYQPEFMAAGLDLTEIANSLAPGYPVVYLITTSHGSLALLVRPASKASEAVQAVWLEQMRSGDLEGLLLQRTPCGGASGGYLVGQITTEPRMMRSGLDLALPVLQDRLVEPLVVRLQELGFQRAALVTGGRLSLLPLHAVTDRVVFTYIPSVRAWQAATVSALKRAERASVLLGVGNPSPGQIPLAYACHEVKDIASRFAPDKRRVLVEHEATRSAISSALHGATHLHFACHGTFVMTRPLDSALQLSDGETLTLSDLLDGDLDLSSTRLVVLSACQTGLVDSKVPDEAIGFPAGFLAAGVPGVVSTLWSVDDISTSILMRRFYLEYLVNGLDPASALSRAQKWLQTATAWELSLADCYELRYQESGLMDSDAFRAMRIFRANPEATPFTHPYYWAGFAFTGVA